MFVVKIVNSIVTLFFRQSYAKHAKSLKFEKIWYFGVKSWFFTRNTPKMFAPPSVRRNFFKCPPPSLKSWIRPCNCLMKDTTKTKHMTGLMDMESFSTHQMAVQTPVTDLVRYVLSDTLVSSSVFVRIKYIKEDKKNSVEHSNSNPLFKISF